MRVMVTGASGFVGSWVLRALADQGHQAHAVCRGRPPVDATFEWHGVDLLSADVAEATIAAAQPEVIVHLAWTVEHGAFWTSPANVDWVAATLRLAQAAAQHGVQRFVGVGTCYEYDWPQHGDCDEASTPIAPTSLYAVAKDATRRVLDAYLAPTATAFAWARLFFLYGPGEGPGRLVPSIARALAAGKPARCSRGHAVRDFLDVRDAAAALASVATSSLEGPVNVASGHAISVADVAMRLAALAGRPELVQMGALPDRAGEPPRIVARTARLASIGGLDGARTIDRGLGEALGYWREQHEMAERR